MNLLREFTANAKATYRLKPRYYWLTTCVGFTAVAMAIAGVCVVGQVCFRIGGAVGIAMLFTSIPAIFYLSAVCVAGIFGASMVCLNRFTSTEAFYYAFFSRYPHRWFRDSSTNALPPPHAADLMSDNPYESPSVEGLPRPRLTRWAARWRRSCYFGIAVAPLSILVGIVNRQWFIGYYQSQSAFFIAQTVLISCAFIGLALAIISLFCGLIANRSIREMER